VPYLIVLDAHLLSNLGLGLNFNQKMASIYVVRTEYGLDFDVCEMNCLENSGCFSVCEKLKNKMPRIIDLKKSCLILIEDNHAINLQTSFSKNGEMRDFVDRETSPLLVWFKVSEIINVVKVNK
jgi:hypothetical protein